MAEKDNASLAHPPEPPAGGEESASALPQDNSGETEVQGGGRQGRSLTFFIKLGSAFFILIILALLVFALAVALTAAETWVPFFQIFRDVLIIIIVVEAILIVTAGAILILQAAGFIIMLKTEIKPILDNARETTRLTKATAVFVSQNSVDPLIQIKSFISGLLGFLREIIRIRALLQTDAPDQREQPDDQASS